MIMNIHCCDAWVAAGGKGTVCFYCGEMAEDDGKCVHWKRARRSRDLK